VTHLVLIARLSKAERESWIERVVAEGLDVRALKKAMRIAKDTPGSALVAARPEAGRERFDRVDSQLASRLTDQNERDRVSYSHASSCPEPADRSDFGRIEVANN
jgi:hypothetical protein